MLGRDCLGVPEVRRPLSFAINIRRRRFRADGNPCIRPLQWRIALVSFAGEWRISLAISASAAKAARGRAQVSSVMREAVQYPSGVMRSVAYQRACLQTFPLFVHPPFYSK